MSKKRIEDEVGYGNAYVFGEWVPSHIEGKILTLIETIGLPEKQEDAIKSLARNIVWDDLMRNTQYITADQHNALRKENEDIGLMPSGPMPIGVGR